MRKLLLTVVLAATVFGAGYWSGTVRSVQAATPRFYELRVYTTYDGKYPDILKRFREHTTAIFEKHGMTNIGYWNAVDAPQKDKVLYYLMAYPSREAREKSWKEFGADPEWKAVQSKSEEGGKIVQHVDSTFLEPTDFSPLQ
jgi:hypothetical protein